MNIADALPTFVAESTDLLVEMEAALLECARGRGGPEAVNLIFRSAHTIKGSSGLFGLQPIVSFVHVMETALDQVRLGRLELSAELITALLACKDHTGALIALYGSLSPGEPSEALRAEETRLLAELKRLTGIGAPAESVERPEAAVAVTGAATAPLWQIAVRFGPDTLRNGMDPLGFIRFLENLGEITTLQLLEAELPEPAAFDPESCYLGFELSLRTTADRARIEAVFEFVREDCTLVITPPAAETPANAVTTAPKAATRPEAEAARPGAEAAARFLRVDAGKLDDLITRVGELIIAAAGTTVLARRVKNDDLTESMSSVTSLVEQVRECALQLRMVKIGATFARFERVVHDVAREIGKEIRLEIRGEDTELDKTVVERIGDPLTHLVRNAIDHGIEPLEVRTARGKPAAGTVTLNAYHDSGSIVIECSDDGGGLKRERILQKALERGLIAAGQELSEEEIFGLIFEPGFSTAENVTNLSGRGVGMDVVKRNIVALRGNVRLASVEGKGTTVTIRLPLTLAIINGFQVAVGRASFILPLDAIEECVEFSCEAGRDFTNLRGQVLPFVRLRELLDVKGPVRPRQSIVIVRHAGTRVGLVVEDLLGELQTVIKPLGKTFRRSECVSGSSVLGSGEVALILDVPALVRYATARATQATELRA
ncbi:MAG TPA: chemotaxis protein CheA [Steroidobacteraceae bacterium]|nr:chemotaxis protein CheA [Steroidobacteraceae bacterium]